MAAVAPPRTDMLATGACTRTYSMGERRAVLPSRHVLAGHGSRGIIAMPARKAFPTPQASRVVYGRGTVFAMAGSSYSAPRNVPRCVLPQFNAIPSGMCPSDAIFRSSDISALQKCRVITAIKTPYKDNGTFDYDTYDQMVDNQIRSGVDVRHFRPLILSACISHACLSILLPPPQGF